jgi:TrmH family RNA methyltransferase
MPPTSRSTSNATGSSTSGSRNRLRPITGRHNPLIKDLRGVYAHGGLTRDGLTDDGCYAIEGVRMMEEAIRSGVRFRAIFFSDADNVATERVTQRLLQQIGHKVETYSVPAKLFQEVVASESPQGVAALVYRKLAHGKESSLEDALRGAQPALLVAVAGLQDPGNLGTILRSAEAFGAGGVVLGEGTVSVYNPKTVRATAGSIFRLPVVAAKLADLIPLLRERGIQLFATSSHKGTPLAEAPLAEPAAFFIGNEGAGLSRDAMSKMDAVLAIPQVRPVESLNAGVAASIILYEAARQRSVPKE